MPRTYLTHLNLSRNELQNAIIQRLASAPSSPLAGLVYFDTTLGKFGVYSGSQWVYMGDIDGDSFVNLTDPQTIGGIKTFTSSPIVPIPTTDTQATNKKYVDDAIVSAGGYTDEQAQDAVGGILTDTATLDLVYDDALNTITGNVLNSPQLNGQNAAYYLSRANHTGTQSADTITDGTTNKVFTATDETKLNHITVTNDINLDTLQQTVDSLESAVVLKGTWDASAGTFPGAGVAQAGWSYIVSVGGTVNGVAFVANDRIVAIADNASTTIYANNWFKLDYTDQVLSVNTQTGAVVLDADDIDDASTAHKFVTAADITKLANTSGTNTGDNVAATTTVQGIVELATDAEAIAKTDTTRAITSSNLASFTRKYAATVGGTTSITVTHNLNSLDVVTQVRLVSTNEVVEVDIINATVNTVTLGFTVAPAASSIRVTVVG